MKARKSTETAIFSIGDTVRALIDNDEIDTLNMNIPYTVFNTEHKERIGIKNGSYWYYLLPSDLEIWE